MVRDVLKLGALALLFCTCYQVDLQCRILCDAGGQCPDGYQCANGFCRAAGEPETACTCSAKVAAGGSHTCALQSGGTVACWGDNTYGQLGDGTILSRATPVAVVGLSGVDQISAGTGHTCARTTDGTAWCWGDNQFAQLGDGTAAPNRTAPTPVVVLPKVKTILAAERHSCALAMDGTVWCWGLNMNGQLGADPVTTPMTSTPLMVQGIPQAARALFVGQKHNCVILDSTSTVWCWGKNKYNQLGYDTMLLDHYAPAQVPNVTAATMALGDHHSCARQDDGSVLCWGENMQGQLGDTTPNPTSLTPIRVMNLGDVDVLAAGLVHTCARRTDGSIWCWGDNSSGEVGAEMTTVSQFPVRVGVLSIGLPGLGDVHSCVVSGDGAIWCWGGNRGGQLGNPSVPVGTTAPRLAFLTCR